MKHVAIIGGGFSGTMTAVQLIENSQKPIKITVFSPKEKLNRGIAYSSYSLNHLLNVVASKMSAFTDKPSHFVEWLLQHPIYSKIDVNIISTLFIPRTFYGDYISNIWHNALSLAEYKGIIVDVVESQICDITLFDDIIQLITDDMNSFSFDFCVLATGNHLPRNPSFKDNSFIKHPNYFQNPWTPLSVSQTTNEFPILIIGNGLTMTDTALSLIENGFKGKIYSLSPHGFNLLPNTFYPKVYDGMVKDLYDNISLFELVKLINFHIKLVKSKGDRVESVIDSLRPYTQKIWNDFSNEDKSKFFKRLRHLWGVYRHRVPLESFNVINQNINEGKLLVIAGKIIQIKSSSNSFDVEYFNSKTNHYYTSTFSKIINCTGPETDISKLDSVLNTCFIKGYITQDNLKLGINTDTNTYQVRQSDGTSYKNLYTLGSNLKGEIWETTAVPEIRKQALEVAINILNA